jgi:putative transcriptional regulator
VTIKKKASKRNIFAEVMDGVAVMRAHRNGRLTLRTHRVEPKPLPALMAAEVRQIRERFDMSREVFARTIHVNTRTLEGWEQGRGVSKDTAVALLLLVREYPDTIKRLQKLAS